MNAEYVLRFYPRVLFDTEQLGYNEEGGSNFCLKSINWGGLVNKLGPKHFKIIAFSY